MIRIAICDDNKRIAEKTKEYVEGWEGEKSICIYHSGEELLKEKRTFDLIFLDIDMPEIDGIETAKNIRKYNKCVKIIYLTSFTEYVNLAFQVHAFAYLNKPINEEEIHKQLKEVTSYMREERKDEFIKFITSEGVVELDIKNIYYFEYFNRKVNIKTKEKTYVIKDKITTIGDKMKKHNFLMPHKSFVVNLLHVKSLKGYDILMMDGTIIPLSQKKAVDFREKLNVFLESCIFM